MKAFSELFEKLDATTSTNKKVAALVDYFSTAPHQDAAWAIYFMSGRRIKRLIPRALMKAWLTEASNMEAWIIDECYNSVGDLAETISLLLPPVDELPVRESELLHLSLSAWIEEKILPLKEMDEKTQGETIKAWWCSMPTKLCFLVTKLLTGALRVGVSQLLVAKALAQVANLDRAIILHRLMGDWQPSGTFFEELIDPDTLSDDKSRPYPFYLASPLDKKVENLGSINEWTAEWKWDGIRAQLIKRDGEIFIWSRGEELISDKFPELVEAARDLADGCVLDGEILAWREGQAAGFNELQRRIGRKKVSQKLREEVPVFFQAYDMLENKNKDIRELSLTDRRAYLTSCLHHHDGRCFGISATIDAQSWSALSEIRQQSRANRVEGLMLKKNSSVYDTGRKKGAWWKWKVDPLSIDAVLLYAQAGHGRRASLFTDYTFAVWEGERLLPVAKAYSGLDNHEINTLDKWIRANTLERFGPVRSVKPEYVFEIGFEGINESSRHKSGIALRFPRILRWRQDMKAEDANTLTMVKDLLNVYGSD